MRENVSVLRLIKKCVGRTNTRINDDQEERGATVETWKLSPNILQSAAFGGVDAENLTIQTMSG